MFDFTISELARVTSAREISDLSWSERVVSGFFSDSNSVIPDGVFVAIKGERTDGHLFLNDVALSGAGLAIINESFQGPIPQEFPVLVVPDSIVALGQIARWARLTKLNATVIAVTGSSGKTTTKDLIAGILSKCGETVSPQGSLNTDVSMPITILGANSDTRYLVLEMGMRGLGHIESLASIAVPDIGVVTNVGSAHMELLGSTQAIAQAKGELIRSLSPTATAILNADDFYVAQMAESTDANVVTFGESVQSDFCATDVRLDSNATSNYTLKHGSHAEAVRVQLRGEHNVSNSLAAISAVVVAGVPISRACELLGEIDHVSKWRMEVTETVAGIAVINDSYNANPESMRAALKTLANMAAGRRTWAVLGPMLELGPSALEEHDSLGRLAVRLDISHLLCVGTQMKITHLAASQEGSWGDESHWVETVDQAIDFLREQLLSGDIVLIKASRSIGLDRVAEALITGDLSKVTGGPAFNSSTDNAVESDPPEGGNS